MVGLLNLLPHRGILQTFQRFSFSLSLAMRNARPAVLKDFLSLAAKYSPLCEVLSFQNLVGLELLVKHTLNSADFFLASCYSRFLSSATAIDVSTA